MGDAEKTNRKLIGTAAASRIELVSAPRRRRRTTRLWVRRGCSWMLGWWWCVSSVVVRSNAAAAPRPPNHTPGIHTDNGNSGRQGWFVSRRRRRTDAGRHAPTASSRAGGHAYRLDETELDEHWSRHSLLWNNGGGLREWNLFDSSSTNIFEDDDDDEGGVYTNEKDKKNWLQRRNSDPPTQRRTSHGKSGPHDLDDSPETRRDGAVAKDVPPTTTTTGKAFLLRNSKPLGDNAPQKPQLQHRSRRLDDGTIAHPLFTKNNQLQAQATSATNNNGYTTKDSHYYYPTGVPIERRRQQQQPSSSSSNNIYRYNSSSSYRKPSMTSKSPPHHHARPHNHPLAEWWSAHISTTLQHWPKIQCRMEPTTTLKIRKTFRPLKTIVRLSAHFNTQRGVWQFQSSWEDAIIGGKLTLAGRKELQLTKSWQLSVGPAADDWVTRLRLRAAVDLQTWKAYVRVGFRTERLAPINVMEGFSLVKQVPLDGADGNVKLEVKANFALPEPEIEYSTETQRSLMGMGDIEVSIEEMNLLLDY